MPAFLVVLSDPKTRKSAKLEMKDQKSQFFVGLKIGDVVDAGAVGVKGKIKITGGSDRSGFPMRPDVHGGVKKHVLLAGPPGIRGAKKGFRRRKMVRGNTVTDDIYQINASLVEGELPQAEQPAPKPA
ncbi:MAG: 30S ribosomal protein S6e [Nitrososphaerota archaeon]|nr:30S ribosomal protein S6e [Nitrososphaerota archaeon]